MTQEKVMPSVDDELIERRVIDNSDISGKNKIETAMLEAQDQIPSRVDINDENFVMEAESSIQSMPYKNNMSLTMVIVMICTFGMVGVLMFCLLLNVESEYTIIIIFVVAFGGVGFAPLIINLRLSASERRLEQEGRLVQATIYDIVYEGNISVNGRVGMLIKAGWRDEKGVPYFFYSRSLWGRKYQYADFEPHRGEFINLYLNPNNYRDYFLDCRELVEHYVH